MGETTIVDVFRAESAEILQKLETGLVALEEKADPDTVNDLFRGFHTLKGSSGMAGFDHVAELTHLVESRLDQVRSGIASAGESFIDLVLDCVDWVRATVAGPRRSLTVSTRTVYSNCPRRITSRSPRRTSWDGLTRAPFRSTCPPLTACVANDLVL